MDLSALRNIIIPFVWVIFLEINGCQLSIYWGENCAKKNTDNEISVEF